jgi:hypothetical protein
LFDAVAAYYIALLIVNLTLLLKFTGFVSLLVIAGFFFLLQLKPMQPQKFLPSKGLPDELHHELAAADSKIFSELARAENVSPIRSIVNHCIAEITNWEPDSQKEASIKAQELVTLEEFKQLITTRSCMEEQYRITAPESLRTKTILAANRESAWKHYAAQERQKLLNMMRQLDVLVAASLLP